MAGRQKFDQEKNPVKMVLYIVVVLLLLGFIGYQVYAAREKNKEYESRLAQLGVGETEYVRPVRVTEAESETETAAETKAKTTVSSSVSSRTTGADEKTTSGMAGETSTEEAAESSAETEEEESLQAKILVLNGTGREGMAGYWKTELEAEGHQEVLSATYTGTLEDTTVIYSRERLLATSFKTYFPDARVIVGTLNEGIEMADGSEVPEDIDVYIVVGKNDARSE